MDLHIPTDPEYQWAYTAILVASGEQLPEADITALRQMTAELTTLITTMSGLTTTGLPTTLTNALSGHTADTFTTAVHNTTVGVPDDITLLHQLTEQANTFALDAENTQYAITIALFLTVFDIFLALLSGFAFLIPAHIATGAGITRTLIRTLKTRHLTRTTLTKLRPHTPPARTTPPTPLRTATDTPASAIKTTTDTPPATTTHTPAPRTRKQTLTRYTGEVVQEGIEEGAQETAEDLGANLWQVSDGTRRLNQISPEQLKMAFLGGLTIGAIATAWSGLAKNLLPRFSHTYNGRAVNGAIGEILGELLFASLVGSTFTPWATATSSMLHSYASDYARQLSHAITNTPNPHHPNNRTPHGPSPTATDHTTTHTINTHFDSLIDHMQNTSFRNTVPILDLLRQETHHQHTDRPPVPPSLTTTPASTADEVTPQQQSPTAPGPTRPPTTTTTATTGAGTGPSALMPTGADRDAGLPAIGKTPATTTTEAQAGFSAPDVQTEATRVDGPPAYAVDAPPAYEVDAPPALKADGPPAYAGDSPTATHDVPPPDSRAAPTAGTDTPSAGNTPGSTPVASDGQAVSNAAAPQADKPAAAPTSTTSPPGTSSAGTAAQSPAARATTVTASPQPASVAPVTSQPGTGDAHRGDTTTSPTTATPARGEPTGRFTEIDGPAVETSLDGPATADSPAPYQASTPTGTPPGRADAVAWSAFAQTVDRPGTLDAATPGGLSVRGLPAADVAQQFAGELADLRRVLTEHVVAVDHPLPPIESRLQTGGLIGVDAVPHPTPVTALPPSQRATVYVPSGLNLTDPNADPAHHRYAQEAVTTGTYRVYGIGSPDGIHLGNRTVSAPELADLITTDPRRTDPRQPVELIACDTGTGSFINELRRLLPGTPVQAPLGPVWTTTSGHAIVADIVHVDGRPRPVLPAGSRTGWTLGTATAEPGRTAADDLTVTEEVVPQQLPPGDLELAPATHWALALETELHEFELSGTPLTYNDVIAVGPGVTIKVDSGDRWKIPEIVSAPGSVDPAEVRPDGSATDLTRRTLDVVQAFRSLQPNERKSLPEVLAGVNGFEATGKGPALTVRRIDPSELWQDGSAFSGTYTQFNTGVAYWRLRTELAADLAAQPQHSDWIIQHLRNDLVSNGLSIGDHFGATLAETDSRVGPLDAEVLAGTLALAYPHVMAPIVSELIGHSDVISKQLLIDASRMTFRALRRDQPVSVRRFLSDNAATIRSRFSAVTRDTLVTRFGESRAVGHLRAQDLIDAQGDLDLFAANAAGRARRDYLNNLLFDEVDERGVPVPFIDQNRAVGITTQFDESDNRGGLPHPLVVVEKRYVNHYLAEQEIASFVEQLMDRNAGAAPPELTRADAIRLLAANEAGIQAIAQANTELTNSLTEWEAQIGQAGWANSNSAAEHDLRRAARNLAEAELSLTYAQERRADVRRSSSLDDLRAKFDHLERNAAEQFRAATGNHRAITAGLAAARNHRTFTPVDEPRLAAITGRIQSFPAPPPAAVNGVDQARRRLAEARENLRDITGLLAEAGQAPPSRQESLRSLRDLATAHAQQAHGDYWSVIATLIPAVAAQPATVKTTFENLNADITRANDAWRQERGRTPTISHLDTARSNLADARQAGSVADQLRASPAPPDADMTRSSRTNVQAAVGNLVDALHDVRAMPEIAPETPAEGNAAVRTLLDSMGSELARDSDDLVETEFNRTLAERHLDVAFDNRRLASAYASTLADRPASDAGRQRADALRDAADDLADAAQHQWDQAADRHAQAVRHRPRPGGTLWGHGAEPIYTDAGLILLDQNDETHARLITAARNAGRNDRYYTVYGEGRDGRPIMNGREVSGPQLTAALERDPNWQAKPRPIRLVVCETGTSYVHEVAALNPGVPVSGPLTAVWVTPGGDAFPAAVDRSGGRPRPAPPDARTDLWVTAVSQEAGRTPRTTAMPDLPGTRHPDWSQRADARVHFLDDGAASGFGPVQPVFSAAGLRLLHESDRARVAAFDDLADGDDYKLAMEGQEGRVEAGGHTWNARDVARLIKGDPAWTPARNISVIGCDAGMHFVQELAEEFLEYPGLRITGALGPTWTKDRHVFVARATVSDGRLRPGRRLDGDSWLTYVVRPGGRIDSEGHAQFHLPGSPPPPPAAVAEAEVMWRLGIEVEIYVELDRLLLPDEGPDDAYLAGEELLATSDDFTFVVEIKYRLDDSVDSDQDDDSVEDRPAYILEVVTRPTRVLHGENGVDYGVVLPRLEGIVRALQRVPNGQRALLADVLAHVPGIQFENYLTNDPGQPVISKGSAIEVVGGEFGALGKQWTLGVENHIWIDMLRYAVASYDRTDDDRPRQMADNGVALGREIKRLFDVYTSGRALPWEGSAVGGLLAVTLPILQALVLLRTDRTDSILKSFLIMAPRHDPLTMRVGQSEEALAFLSSQADAIENLIRPYLSTVDPDGEIVDPMDLDGFGAALHSVLHGQWYPDGSPVPPFNYRHYFDIAPSIDQEDPPTMSPFELRNLRYHRRDGIAGLRRQTNELVHRTRDAPEQTVTSGERRRRINGNIRLANRNIGHALEQVYASITLAYSAPSDLIGMALSQTQEIIQDAVRNLAFAANALDAFRNDNTARENHLAAQRTYENATTLETDIQAGRYGWYPDPFVGAVFVPDSIGTEHRPPPRRLPPTASATELSTILARMAGVFVEHGAAVRDRLSAMPQDDQVTDATASWLNLARMLNVARTEAGAARVRELTQNLVWEYERVHELVTAAGAGDGLPPVSTTLPPDDFADGSTLSLARAADDSEFAALEQFARDGAIAEVATRDALTPAQYFAREAMKIEFTGTDASDFDAYYRARADSEHARAYEHHYAALVGTEPPVSGTVREPSHSRPAYPSIAPVPTDGDSRTRPPA